MTTLDPAEINNSSILVTGGAGFIGSAFVRYLINNTNCRVINVDKLTYAGNLESLAEVWSNPGHIFRQIDICDRASLDRVLNEHQPSAIVHLAAESHVDRSIHGPAEFIHTNILGTYNLLEAARNYWENLTFEQQERFRFLHVSTDEVYGSLGMEGAFREDSPYRPNSPYAASKASSDHLVRAWHHTYGMPVLVTNCSNNFGPYQFPEKFIPLMVLNAIQGKTLPVYGQGENIRDWLYVQDHARALLAVLVRGESGRVYNIGGGCEKRNIDVVREICNILEELVPIEGNNNLSNNYSSLIKFVSDRPGHDLRYAIDNTRITGELCWHPQESFRSGLEKTIRWYLENPEWVSRVRSGEYRQWLETNYASRDMNL